MMTTNNSRQQNAGKIRAIFSAFWSRRNQRERHLLSAALGFILLVLIYLILIGPALRGRTRLQKELPSLRMQSVELQALISSTKNFSTHSVERMNSPLTKDDLEIGLKNKGLHALSTMVSGDTALVKFSSVTFSVLFDWLNEAQKTSHWQVVDVNITTAAGTAVSTDTVDATISLRQQSHE